MEIKKFCIGKDLFHLYKSGKDHEQVHVDNFEIMYLIHYNTIKIERMQNIQEFVSIEKFISDWKTKNTVI